MLAEFGTLSLADVLAPAIELADGYPIEAETADTIERDKDEAQAVAVLERTSCCRIAGEPREAPDAGEIFRQPDLAATLRKLVEAEQQALKSGKIAPGGDPRGVRSLLPGDIAEEFVRGVQEQGGLHHARGSRELEASDRGARHHELSGHRRLQARRLDAGSRAAAGAEHARELRPAAMGYNSAALHPHCSTRR